MRNPSRPQRLPLLRPTRELIVPGQPRRVLLGVAAGVAIHLQIPVNIVRIIFVITLFIFPLTLLYPLLALLVPSGNPWEQAAARRREGRGSLARSLGESGTGIRAETQGEAEKRNFLIVAAVLISAGAMMLLAYGFRGYIHPVFYQIIFTLLGLALTWSQNDRMLKYPIASALAIAGGLVLIAIGVIAIINGFWVENSLFKAVVTGLAVVGFVIIAVLPVMLQLNRQLMKTQVERAQESQRADIAAHLHDSVLQTLALIRQQADDPQAVASLARSQERELRGWLYGSAPATEQTTVQMLREVLGQIEDKNNCVVELVNVGDCPATETTQALVAAIGEAVTNAVKHAAAPFSVYLEVMPNSIDVYVRDHGAGFNPAMVPADRHGVRDSIIGRVERVGGSAQIRSGANGTEVALKVARA